MIDPDVETLKSIITLKGNRDFMVVLKWFNDSLMIQSIENNAVFDPTASNATKGGNLELKQFIDKVAGANALLKTLTEPKINPV